MKQKIFNFPRVGIRVLIFRGNKILLGKRKGSHGGGEYAFPGGHLEYMETIEDCAKRETFEEAGIKIKNVRFQFVANIHKYKPKHYLHIGVIADYRSGKEKVRELEKCENWKWYSLDKLPRPLFFMAKLSIIALKTKRIFFDKK